MKKTFLKNWRTISISTAIFALAGIIWACSDDDFPYYGHSDFTPEAFVHPKYTPFFFSFATYYDKGYDNSYSYRFEDINLDEWASYLNGLNLKRTELKYLLYDASLKEIKKISDGDIDKNRLPTALKTSTLFSQKNNPKIKAFLTYLQIAKVAENYANAPEETSWYYEDKPKPIFDMKDYKYLEGKLKTQLDQAKDEFIRKRYWFQLVRYYYFDQQLDKSTALFNSIQAEMTKDVMYYRTMAYAAGSYYKQKNFSQANYLYSLVYEQCDNLKTVAHYSFHPQDEKDWKATLAFAQNVEEKITLWQMLGVFYEDEKRSIKEIYQLNPRSEKLDLLLVRAINKLEQTQNAISNRSGYELNIDKSGISLLLKLIQNDIQISKTFNPFLWYCAESYLLMMNGSFDEANQVLNKTNQYSANNDLQKWQLRLLKLVNTVAGAKVIDSNFENNILADLEWLQQFNHKDESIFRYEDALLFIRQNLSDKYKNQKDYFKSELFVSDDHFYNDTIKMNQMIDFLSKKNHTNFERLMIHFYPYDLDNLYEQKATIAAYHNHIDKAIAFMKKAPKAASSILRANPFNGFIKDCHDCEFDRFKGKALNKLSFLEKIKEMQEQLNQQKDLYNNSLLLGNAFYNMSHYGNSRVFYESKGGIIEGAHSPLYLQPDYRPLLTSMKQAKDYYNKAFQAASNDEERAKCVYLLAKCERNDWYNQNVYDIMDKYTIGYGYYDTLIPIQAITHFKTLKNQYQNTKYYQEVIRECGYFKKYVKGNF